MEQIFKRYSTLCIVLGAVMWGIIGIFVRRLNALGFGSLETMAVRSIFAAAVLLIYTAVFDREKLKVRPCDLWLFFGSGVLSFLVFGCFYFAAIDLTSMSTAAMLLYTSPVFVTLMAAVFFREKITKLKVAAVIATLVGSALIAGGFGGEPVGAKGLFFGLMSGFCYALYSIFARFAQKRYSTQTIIVYTFLFAAAGSFFAADIPKTAVLIASDLSLIPFAAVFAVVTAVLPYILYTGGLKYTSAGSAAVTACIEPVVASVAGMLFFHEMMSLGGILGALLILGAVFVQNLGTGKQES